MSIQSDNSRVVITGIGVLASTGIGKEAYYQHLQTGNSGVQIKENWMEEGIERAFFHACPDFNIKDYFQKLRAPYPMRYSQLAMLGCQLAYADAGLEGVDIPDNRIGMILNTTYAANEAVEAYLSKLFVNGPRKASPFKFTRTVSNTALGDVTLAKKFRGVSSMVLGESSVCYGFDLLKKGEADLIFCGGFDEVRDVILLPYQDRDLLLPSPSPNCISDQAALINSLKAHPGRNKTVPGEASAFLVLETLEHARKRQAHIYAEMLDYSTAFDHSFENFIYERQVEDFQAVMEEGLQRSALSNADIDLIVGAAGLPWQYNEYEGKAIESLWESESVRYTTIKPFVGETFGASSQASLAAAALMIENKEVFGHGLPEDLFDTQAGPVRLNEKTEKVDQLEHVMVNSTNASGNTSTFLLKSLNE
jgi:3-oxoacyl-[acyl-carrier-protein] synthase II